MKNLSLISLCFLFLCSSAFSQQPTVSQIKSQELNRKIVLLYQQGNLDEAIPLAEEVVELEKKSSSENQQSLATAYFNVGLLRKKRYQDNYRKYLNRDYKKGDKLTKKLEEDAKKSEKAFRKVIEIHEDEIKKETAQLADAQNELAWLLYNYSEFGFWKLTITQQQIGEAEQLYQNSIALREKIFGADADETLSSVFNLAEYYLRYVKFEKALSNYQRFISTIEKKYGEDQKILIPALNSVADILVATNDDEKAKEIIKRITEIGGKEKDFPEADFILNGRMISPESSAKVSDKRVFAAQYTYTPTYRIILLSPMMTNSTYKSVPVKVLIDEDGGIIEATANIKDEKLKKEAEEAVKEWRFYPFEYEGKRTKLRGYVIFRRVIHK